MILGLIWGFRFGVLSVINIRPEYQVIAVISGSMLTVRLRFWRGIISSTTLGKELSLVPRE